MERNVKFCLQMTLRGFRAKLSSRNWKLNPSQKTVSLSRVVFLDVGGVIGVGVGVGVGVGKRRNFVIVCDVLG